MPDLNPLFQAELAAAVASDDCLARLTVVCALTGLRTSHIKSMVKRGAFPRSIKLAPKVVRWRAGDVKRWLAEQAAAAA